MFSNAAFLELVNRYGFEKFTIGVSDEENMKPGSECKLLQKVRRETQKCCISSLLSNRVPISLSTALSLTCPVREFFDHMKSIQVAWMMMMTTMIIIMEMEALQVGCTVNLTQTSLAGCFVPSML